MKNKGFDKTNYVSRKKLIKNIELILINSRNKMRVYKITFLEKIIIHSVFLLHDQLRLHPSQCLFQAISHSISLYNIHVVL